VRTADPSKAPRIIEAAAQLFSERPYHEVRMEDIAARAKVAKGTLYLHYKDKEALYVGLMLEGMNRLIARIEESLEGVSEPAEKLLVMNREAVRHFERDVFFLDLIPRLEAINRGEEAGALRACRGRLQGILAEILQEFPRADRSASGPGDFELEVLAVSGMMKEVLQNLSRPWPEDLPERITRLVLHGVAPAATPARSRK
jgi:AcrR family transcriptional regulator